MAEHNTEAVVNAMITEMQRQVPSGGVKTIYIGGGSPSSLSRELLLLLVYQAAKQCPDAEEFTVEINPGQADMELLFELRNAGVNRLSIGAQSFIQRELDFLGRKYDTKAIDQTIRQARNTGFDNISMDLIFAVPGSDPDSWKRNLNRAAELAVEHISAYSLTYEHGTPLSRDLDAGMVKPVDEETDREMYYIAIDELERTGIHQYEISNFAKPGFQCRHNLNYWANGSYFGIGPGAASYLRGTRSTNYADIKKYTDAAAKGENTAQETETLSEIERACETAVLNLRRRCGIETAEFERKTGFDALRLFAEPVSNYQRQGLIKVENGRICLTRDALVIADSILCDFSTV
ncbi:MAG: radical SAM family heme chaperone HemW [Candidatus Brocadiia bacterium]|nr:MAG: radical SAM family heme chaperone HemW [Candidatus Brocadiia bacterium]